jgi:hypothetical protein
MDAPAINPRLRGIKSGEQTIALRNEISAMYAHGNIMLIASARFFLLAKASRRVVISIDTHWLKPFAHRRFPLDGPSV